jgi:hypothetical protein
MAFKMPPTKSAYFAFQGGLDLVTPALSIPPGRTFDSLNYEPEISGGYRRIDGYERFDGHPSPTDDAKYVSLRCSLTNTVAIDSDVTGVVSGVSGKCVGVIQREGYTELVISGVDYTEDVYDKDEQITSNGFTVGFVLAQSSLALFPEDDADYQLLAANDIRRDIDVVPGSGEIRGIFTLNDNVYAFRDSPDGLTQNMFRADPGGWTQISYGQEMQFTNGIVEVKAGDLIKNAGNTVSAVVAVVLTRSGTWNNTGDPQAQGTIILSPGTLTGGTFIDGELLYVAGVARCTCKDGVTNITRQGGATQKMELIKYSFASKTGPQVVYGVDGKNLAFEFNGTNFIPIRTGMAVDAPNHIAAHLNYLFLAYGSSIQFSAVNNPYSWTVILGAGEFSAGDLVTSMLPMVGGNQDPAMAIFTNSKVNMLYGSGQSSFKLQNTVTEIGYAAGTVQPLSGSALGLTARGLQTLAATQNFGDFSFSTISSLIQPLINKLRGTEQCSVVLKNKNQYRVYHGDENGTCIVVGFTSDRITGIMPLEYGRPVRCIWTETFSDGVERTFFGSDDGYVYEDNKGTSFDGEEIESWVRLVFNHQQSPRLRKRWRRASIEAKVDSFSAVNFSYDLGYGNPDVSPPPNTDDAILVGGKAGYWDQFQWDKFHWDAQSVLSPVINIDGTEKNISLIFYSKRAQDSSHTLQGCVLEYTERRQER